MIYLGCKDMWTPYHYWGAAAITLIAIYVFGWNPWTIASGTLATIAWEILDLLACLISGARIKGKWHCTNCGHILTDVERSGGGCLTCSKEFGEHKGRFVQAWWQAPFDYSGASLYDIFIGTMGNGTGFIVAVGIAKLMEWL